MLVEMPNSAVTQENNSGVSYKVKHTLLKWPRKAHS